MREEDFGKIMKEKRKERGITLEELAKMTNVSAAYLSRLERGERQAPSYNIMDKIFTALGMTWQLEENVGLEAEFLKLKELIIMYREKGNMSIRETIELMEMIEDMVKG